MIDTTYSFFSCPDLEDIPAPTQSKQHTTMMVLRKESTRMSQPDVVAYMPSSTSTTNNTTAATTSMTREEWIMDTTYGYFDCPSLHPEPMMHHKANHTVDATRAAAPRSGTPPRRQLRCTDHDVDDDDDHDDSCQDGYSFFGI